MSSTPVSRVRALHPGEVFAGRYLGDDYEQPINWARMAVLGAVALPVFAGLYYALLNFLLFG
jgi:hypothetical protein